MRTKLYISAMVAVFILYISVVLGHKSSAYYGILILLIPLFLYMISIYGKAKKEKIIDTVKIRWGKTFNHKVDFEELMNYYDVTEPVKNSFGLDVQTWNDLNMNDLYLKMDSTYTAPGRSMLYKILRSPLLDKNELIKRDKAIDLFKDNSDLRNAALTHLYKLGSRGGEGLQYLINNEETEDKTLLFWCNILAILPLAAIVSIIFLGPSLIFYALIPSIIINMVVYFKVKSNVKFNLISISYLRNLIIAGRDLGTSLQDPLTEYSIALKKNSKECWNIVKKVGGVNLDSSADPFGIAIYFDIVFLVGTRSYLNALNDIKNKRAELMELFAEVGEIDALISVASYREQSEQYVKPVFNDKQKIINVQNIYHPLVENPIANSLDLREKGVILTGSNMSGKSTFLRCIGANAVLAQTIYMCHADKYECSMFCIMTSISRADNIIGGKSYYLAEAETIHDMIEKINDNNPCLIIIDEIFRGTNTIERIEASGKILKYLIKENAIVFVATHDLELKNIIEESYDTYYFSENVGSEGLEFDYTLKKGVSPGGNAIKILKLLGYPEEITN